MNKLTLKYNESNSEEILIVYDGISNKICINLKRKTVNNIHSFFLQLMSFAIIKNISEKFELDDSIIAKVKDDDDYIDTSLLALIDFIKEHIYVINNTLGTL